MSDEAPVDKTEDLETGTSVENEEFYNGHHDKKTGRDLSTQI